MYTSAAHHSVMVLSLLSILDAMPTGGPEIYKILDLIVSLEFS